MMVATTALFLRTLRLDTRAMRGYGLRVLLGALVLLMLAGTQSTSYARAAAGHDLLEIIAWCAFGCMTLAGLSHFCSAITEEKEEATLGLMRMAGLDPLSILLGKSTARLWDALLLAATMLPFATVAVTLGGVALNQVLACAAALAAYVFMLANIGLLASVVMRTSQSAGSVMTLALLVLLVCPFFSIPARLAGGGWAWVASLLDGIGRASVVSRLNLVLSTGYSGSAGGSQVWLDLVIGLACFALAWLVFDRFAHVEAETAPAAGVVRRRSRLNILRLPRPPHGLAAIAWKDFNFVCGGRLMFLIKSLLALVLVLLFAVITNRLDASWRNCGDTMMVVATIWFVLEVGAQLSRLYSCETRDQTLDGILGLPYELRWIAYTKLRALLPTLIPVVALFAVGAGMASDSLLSVLDEMWRYPGSSLTTFSVLLYFWHVCAWISLVVRRGALAAAIGIMLITWFALGMAVAFVSALMRGIGGESSIWLMTAFFLITSALMHVGVARRLRLKAGG